MSDFKVGDKIEVIFHAVKSYVGKQGKVMFVGSTFRQGTDMLENNMNTSEQEARLIVVLDDSTVINDVKSGQIRKL